MSSNRWKTADCSRTPFARFFLGDFASAAYLLIPQLEASLRHILKAHGADPTKRRDDATEEDGSLDAIIAITAATCSR